MIDGELDGVVPRMLRSSGSVDGSFLLVVLLGIVAVDPNDGVYVHLGDEVDIFKILCGVDV